MVKEVPISVLVTPHVIVREVTGVLSTVLVTIHVLVKPLALIAHLIMVN